MPIHHTPSLRRRLLSLVAVVAAFLAVSVTLAGPASAREAQTKQLGASCRVTASVPQGQKVRVASGWVHQARAVSHVYCSRQTSIQSNQWLGYDVASGADKYYGGVTSGWRTVRAGQTVAFYSGWVNVSCGYRNLYSHVRGVENNSYWRVVESPNVYVPC